MKKWNITQEFLEENYIERKLSTRQISKVVGCCSKTIDRKLKEFNIPTRTKNQALALYRNGKYVDCSNACGRKVYRKGRLLKKFDVFFCSWDCAKEYQSKTKKKLPFELGWRSYKEYRKWRSYILDRDKKCLLCGSINKLVAHHILEA